MSGLGPCLAGVEGTGAPETPGRGAQVSEIALQDVVHLPDAGGAGAVRGTAVRPPPDRARCAALRADFETQRGEPETGGLADGDYAHYYDLNGRLDKAVDEVAEHLSICAAIEEANSWPSWPRTWAAASSEAAPNSMRRGASHETGAVLAHPSVDDVPCPAVPQAAPTTLRRKPER